MLTLTVRKGIIVKNKGLLYNTIEFAYRTTSISSSNKATWTTLVQAGGLDKPATLKFVMVSTLDTEQPFFPTSWT